SPGWCGRSADVRAWSSTSRSAAGRSPRSICLATPARWPSSTWAPSPPDSQANVVVVTPPPPLFGRFGNPPTLGVPPAKPPPAAGAVGWRVGEPAWGGGGRGPIRPGRETVPAGGPAGAVPFDAITPPPPAVLV